MSMSVITDVASGEGDGQGRWKKNRGFLNDWYPA